jgi:hypothetical protein
MSANHTKMSGQFTRNLLCSFGFEATEKTNDNTEGSAQDVDV